MADLSTIGTGAGSGAAIGGTIGSIIPGVGNAIGSGIGGVLGAITGFFAPVAGKGKDQNYINDVNKQRQIEYNTAQSAISTVNTIPAAQAEIVAAYNQEQALWGDPNNPNRNVAKPDVYTAQVNSIIQKYAGQTVTETATGTITTQGTAQTDISGQLTSFLNQLSNLVPQAPGSKTDNTQLYIMIGLVGIVGIYFLTKGK